MTAKPLSQEEATDLSDKATTTVTSGTLPLPVIPLIIVGLLFLGIYAPTFLWMMQRWQIDPSATHGWLVIPIAGAVAYGRRDRLRSGKRQVRKGVTLYTGKPYYVIDLSGYR